MKLRTAYFCKQCDEEVILSKDTAYKCPHCGYHNVWGLASIYEWKVPVDSHFHADQGIGI